MTAYVWFIIVVALGFDFVNGFHDAANSVATLVATKAFKRKFHAVLWAAFWNFIAFKMLGTGVAKAIGADIIKASAITPTVILAALLGAISWNLITWWRKIPSSSSHALMGGFAGAAIVYANDFTVLKGSGWVMPCAFIILAPMMAMLISRLLLGFINLCVRKVPPALVDKHSKWFQYLSAALFSFGHGANDAQKTMGIITSLLVSVHYLNSFQVPMSVVYAAHTAIALGTLCGGWRIVQTLAFGIGKKDMRPHEGFCASAAAGICIILATKWKIPLSTSHTATGGITGVALAHGIENVSGNKFWEIFKYWVATMLFSACIAAGFFYLLHFGFGL